VLLLRVKIERNKYYRQFTLSARRHETRRSSCDVSRRGDSVNWVIKKTYLTPYNGHDFLLFMRRIYTVHF